MNVKMHILVNLGQFKDVIPINSMPIEASFWIVEMVNMFQKRNRVWVPQ